MANSGALVLRTLSTNQDAVLLGAPDGSSSAVTFRSPTSAMYVGATGPTLYELRGSTVITHTSGTNVIGADGLVARGDYAVWRSNQPGSNDPLLLLNVQSSVVETVTTGITTPSHALTAGGTVLYWKSTGTGTADVFRYAGGVTTNLTNGVPGPDNRDPVTDGTNVLFESTGAAADNLYLYTAADGQFTQVASFAHVFATSTPGQEYAAEEGWIAWKVPTVSPNDCQIWTRSAAGVMSLVTTGPRRKEMLKLGADGSIAFVDEGILYLAAAGEPRIDLGPAGPVGGYDRAFWADDRWYIVPVPEPAVLVSVVPGIGAMVGRGRRRYGRSASVGCG